LLFSVNSVPAAQTFSWDGTDWRLLAVNPTTPSAIYALAYDSVRSRTIALTNDTGGNTQTWSFEIGAACAHPTSAGWSGSTLDLPDTGGFLFFPVDLPAGCGWTAATSAAWTSVTPSSGTGTTTLRVSGNANITGAQRTAYVTVSGRSTLVRQTIPGCDVSGPLPGTPFVVRNSCGPTYSYTAAAGEQIAFQLVGQASPATSNATLTIWNPARTAVLMTVSTPSAEGPIATVPATQQSTFTFPAAGTYLIEVTANGTPDVGTRIEYVKSGFACTPKVTAYSAAGLEDLSVFNPYTGGASGPWLSVGLPPGCPNIAITPGASWLTIDPSTTISPGYTRYIRLNLATNFGAARSTTLTIGSTSINVSQPAGSCGYALNGTSTSVDSNRNTGELALTANQSGCSWTASSNASWLQIFPLSGSGSATVRYTVFPNFGTKTRSATLTVGGKTFTVTQGPTTGTSMERYVRLLYFNFFGRLPTAPEIAWHANSGLTRGQLALNFFTSQEFTNGGRFVAGLYVGVLGRDAEYGGWLFQRDALMNGINTHDPLIRNFLSSQEFALRNGTLSDSQFVTLMYRQILLREPNSDEVAFQTSVLTGGISRSVLTLSFLLSQEFVIGTGPRLIAFLSYAGLLQRDPTPIEFEAAKGMAVANLLAGLVNSGEFGGILE
jgi:hypothetical protein